VTEAELEGPGARPEPEAYGGAEVEPGRAPEVERERDPGAEPSWCPEVNARHEGDRAFELSLRYLNRRERTEAEVRGHLQGRGLGAAATEDAIERLRDSGLLDDARFARLFCEDKRHLEQWGSERIVRSLRARGIVEELIEQVVAEVRDGPEIEVALEVLRRRFPGGLEPEHRDRAFGVLVRKGFETELASDALRAYVHSDG
jgi:regulatory protein